MVKENTIGAEKRCDVVELFRPHHGWDIIVFLDKVGNDTDFLAVSECAMDDVLEGLGVVVCGGELSDAESEILDCFVEDLFGGASHVQNIYDYRYNNEISMLDIMRYSRLLKLYTVVHVVEEDAGVQLVSYYHVVREFVLFIGVFVEKDDLLQG